MTGRDVAAALLDAAWISARIAAGLSLAAVFAAALAAHARAGRDREAAPARRPGSSLRVAAMAGALLAGALATALAPGQVEAWAPVPLQGLAAGLAALSCLAGGMVAAWAALSLGPNFALHAGVRGDGAGTLVTSGPFALVRHPLYAALALVAAGAALAWGSLAGLVVVAVAYPPAARWRAALEEEALAGAWPDAWAAYAARTPRFVPRL